VGVVVVLLLLLLLILGRILVLIPSPLPSSLLSILPSAISTSPPSCEIIIIEVVVVVVVVDDDDDDKDDLSVLLALNCDLRSNIFSIPSIQSRKGGNSIIGTLILAINVIAITGENKRVNVTSNLTIMHHHCYRHQYKAIYEEGCK